MANELVSLKEQIGESALFDVGFACKQLAAVKEVSSDSDARRADDCIKSGKKMVKLVHDERLAITKKVDLFKNALIADEKIIVKDLSEELSRVSSMTAEYLAAKQRAKEERERAAREKAMREQAEAERQAAMESALTGREVVAPTVVADIQRKHSKPVSGVSSRTVWTFKVVDPYAVPRQYCSPDEKLIREFMNQAKAEGSDVSELKIPGVEFAKEIRV